MNTSRRIARLLVWHQILHALDLAGPEGYPATQLPYTLRCPLCRDETLTLYSDHAYQSAWHHCVHCGSAGDLLELASKVWGLEPEAALYKLAARGALELPPGFQRSDFLDYELHAKDQARVQEFWEYAQDRFCQEEPDTRLLRMQLNVEQAGEKKAWQRKCGRFLGSASREALQEFLGQHFQTLLTDLHFPRLNHNSL